MWPGKHLRCQYSRIAGSFEWWFLKAPQRRVVHITAGIFFVFTIFCLIFTSYRNPSLCNKRKKTCSCDLIVPDIIHFYRNEKEAVNISIIEGVCLRAARRLHEQVWIHTANTTLTLQEMKHLGLLSNSFKVLPLPYGPGPVHLNILRQYGGIFLKNDIYLLDRLDQMRGHEWSSAGNNDIVSGTQEGVANGRESKLKDILFDKNYGALYLKDLSANCEFSAVRLGVR